MCSPILRVLSNRGSQQQVAVRVAVGLALVFASVAMSPQLLVALLDVGTREGGGSDGMSCTSLVALSVLHFRILPHAESIANLAPANNTSRPGVRWRSGRA